MGLPVSGLMAIIEEDGKIVAVVRGERARLGEMVGS
jgi:hypothetical protein